MVIYDLLTGMIVKELAGHQGVVRYSPAVVVSCLLIENLPGSLYSTAPQLDIYRYIPVIVVSWLYVSVISTNHLIRDVSWHPYRQEIISSSWDFSVLRWGCHTFVEIIMNNQEDQTRIITQISYQNLMMTSQ